MKEYRQDMPIGEIKDYFAINREWPIGTPEDIKKTILADFEAPTAAESEEEDDENTPTP